MGSIPQKGMDMDMANPILYIEYNVFKAYVFKYALE